ncbi:POC1 centriolar protein A [Ceratobasidium sp. 395]|nr:POC1 centriolar protein A [Ceratobasidium sp. 395]
MSADQSQELTGMLRGFASERFLLWMEVMNLSGMIQEGVSTLDKVRTWPLSTHFLDEDMRRFVRDMWMFANAFASSRAWQSTPHIYVSILTFWPDHSPISNHYGQGQARLTTERSTANLREFMVVATPDVERSISSVSYSPDGAYIISGSDDQTIRIWDAHTGQPVEQPTERHTGFVGSVAYSPDGANIVSGSGDDSIRIWEMHIHQPAGQLREGHSDYVQSIVYPPLGERILSGSEDGGVWDTRTGQPVGQPIERHTNFVKSVAYTPDGAYIVSLSDNNIRFWYANTRRPVEQPLAGRTSLVQSAAYSPDGAYYVSGFDDNTIRIWSTSIHKPVGQPLKGHTSEVRCLAYSPDGTCFVSGSHDTTLRVWDMNLVASLKDNVSEIDDGRSQLVHSLPVTSEPRMLCHLGCQIYCPHMAWTLNDSGWIVFNGNKLIWVPPGLRKTVLCPQNTALMFTHGFLHLDLNRNKLGEHWHEYFQPGGLSNRD